MFENRMDRAVETESSPAKGAAPSSLASWVPLISLAYALAACGPAGAPSLLDIRCAEESSCQSLSDPFLLELEVDFEDPDGDLGAGTYSVFVDGLRTDGPHQLLGYFEVAGLSAYATEGTLQLPAGVQISGISSGMTFVVAIEVEDFEGNRSNRPGIRFRLDLH